MQPSHRFLLAAVLLTASAFSALPASAGEYAHSIEVKKMTFDWKVDGDRLRVRLKAPTTGWVAIGFNPLKGMMGADLILGYVEDGKVTVSDEFGNQENAHEPDTKQGGTNDLTDISGTEANDATEIRFTRLLKPADPKDGEIKTDKFITIALAYSAKRDSLNTKHLQRAKVQVNLGTGEMKPL